MNCQRHVFRVEGMDHTVCVFVDQTGRTYVKTREKFLEVSLQALGPSTVLLILGNERVSFQVEESPDGLRLIHDGELLSIKKSRGHSLAPLAGIHVGTKIVIKSNMPGLVAALNARENQVVQEGETLVMIEAMKMQNPVKAPASGKIRKVMVSLGMSIENGTPLVQMIVTRS